jgi:hypothetical protein
MAIPRVFVSSTWYDLKYIRENLRYFIKTLGYDPVLSEDGGVFYKPSLHTHDACLTEIPTCQMFVLIIGGRFGGQYHDGTSSITNREYREAVKQKIPVFALVDSAVYNEHHVFAKNKTNKAVDLTKLNFPAVDSTKIFEFIDEVRTNSLNNALVPFKDFAEIEIYLRQQWAGMMFDFLNSHNQEAKVLDTLSTLEEMNRRIEMLSKQILKSVGTEDTKLDAELYEEMIASEAVRDLAWWGLRLSPRAILTNSSFRDCAESHGVKVTVQDKDEMSITGGGTITASKYKHSEDEYQAVRTKLQEILSRHGKTAEEYIAEHPVENLQLEPAFRTT